MKCVILIVATIIGTGLGCTFLESLGLSPVSLGGGKTYPVLPQPVTTENNAFVQNGLLRALPALTGNNYTLMENLKAFATKEKQDLCYWAWQGLPPPRGDGPTFWHPHRGYYDVSDGQAQQFFSSLPMQQ